MNRHDRRRLDAIQRSVPKQHEGLLGHDGKPMERPTRVQVVIPSTDMVHADFAVNFAALMHFTAAMGVEIGLYNQKGSSIGWLRNALVKAALERGPDYLFWIDSDIVTPPTAICDLLAHKKDIVCATYNRRVPPYNTLGHLLGPEQDLSSGPLVEADFVPGGLILVRTEVYRRMKWPWYWEGFFRHHRDGVSKREAFFELLNDHYESDVPAGLRSRLESDVELMAWVDEQSMDTPMATDKEFMGEDYAFCRKARRLGYKIWCDMALTFKCAHLGQQAVTCVPAPIEQPQEAAA